MSDSKHVTYEDAGVDTAEGGRAVDAIKQMVKDTNRPEVIGGIGGFGGLFSAAALKDMEDPILISGTDDVGTKPVLLIEVLPHGHERRRGDDQGPPPLPRMQPFQHGCAHQRLPQADNVAEDNSILATQES